MKSRDVAAWKNFLLYFFYTDQNKADATNCHMSLVVAKKKSSRHVSEICLKLKLKLMLVEQHFCIITKLFVLHEIKNMLKNFLCYCRKCFDRLTQSINVHEHSADYYAKSYNPEIPIHLHGSRKRRLDNCHRTFSVFYHYFSVDNINRVTIAYPFRKNCIPSWCKDVL